MRIGQLKSSKITSSLRFSASYHLSDAVSFEEIIKSRDFKLLGDLANEIFTSGRCKRSYTTKKYGAPFLGNNEITSFNPKMGCKFISKKLYNDERAFLKEGMILTGRVGQDTVGAYSYCSKELEDCIGSDNIIRIVIDQKHSPGFVYAFLASKYGYHLTRRYITGGAQPFVTENMISGIPIPIFSETKRKKINKLVTEAASFRIEANSLLEKCQCQFHEKLGINEDQLLLLNSPLERDIEQSFLIKSSDLNNKTLRARNYSRRKFRPIY